MAPLVPSAFFVFGALAFTTARLETFTYTLTRTRTRPTTLASSASASGS